MISQYDQLNYAQFQPLSMQEIWAAPQALRAQHDQLSEELAQQELLGGAASLGLQKGIDDVAIATNQKYMDETKKAADELATKGFIDAGRRRNLMSLKQQYTQNVLPIQNALKVRDEAARFDREMKAKDQTYRSTFDPSKVAVTDYLNNNQAFNPQGVSVGIMSKDAANEFSQLKNLVSQKYPSIAQSGVIGTLWTKVNSGVSLKEISGFIKNEAANKNIDPKVLSSLGQEMHNIVENNLQKHGAYKAFGNNENAMKDLRSSVANMAIYSLGDPKFGQMNDPMAIWTEQQKQQKQQNQGNNELPVDVINSPEIANNPKFQKYTKDLDFLKNLGHYIDTKKYEKSKEAEAMIKEMNRLRTAPINTKYESAMSRAQQMQDLATQIQIKHPYYESSKRVEEIAKRYGGKTVGEIKANLNRAIENQKLLLSDTYIKDVDGTITKSAFKNIAKDQNALNRLKKADSNFDINKYDAEDFSVGHSFDGTPIVSFVNKDNKVVRVEMPHEIIGNPNSVSALRPTSHSNLYKQIIKQEVDVNSNVNSGGLIDNKDGTYSIPGFDYSNAKGGIVKVGNNNIQTRFTKDELNNGLDNPSLRYLMNQKSKEIFTKENAGLSTGVKFEPIKIGY